MGIDEKIHNKIAKLEKPSFIEPLKKENPLGRWKDSV